MDIVRECDNCARKNLCKIKRHIDGVLEKSSGVVRCNEDFTVKLDCQFAMPEGPVVSGHVPGQNKKERLFFDQPPCDTCDFEACWVSSYNKSEINSFLRKLSDSGFEAVKVSIACKGYCRVLKDEAGAGEGLVSTHIQASDETLPIITWHVSDDDVMDIFLGTEKLLSISIDERPTIESVRKILSNMGLRLNDDMTVEEIHNHLEKEANVSPKNTESSVFGGASKFERRGL